jgi:hypothetical protein
MQISVVNLALIWPLQVLFTQSSVHDATATSFPLSKHTGGGDTALTFSGLHVYLQFTWKVGLPLSPVEFSSHHHFYKLSCSDCCCVLLLLLAGVFVYSSRGRWVFPPLLWSFPPSTTLTSFPTSGCWALLACLFTVLGGIPLPPSLVLRVPHPLVCVFIVLIAYYSVSVFSLGEGWSVQEAMPIWLRVVCGSTAYHLAHLVVHVFPSCLGVGGWWWPGGPPGFSFQLVFLLFLLLV